MRVVTFGSGRSDGFSSQRSSHSANGDSSPAASIASWKATIFARLKPRS